MSDHHDNQLHAAEKATDCQNAERQSEARAQARRRSRRRLFKVGLAAVPVIMTLRARPARADIQTSLNDPNFFITGHSPDDQPPPPEGQGSDWLRSDRSSSSSDWSTSDWSGESSGDGSGEGQGETQF